MKTDKPVSIAIVTAVRNRRDITLQCLRSLARIDRTGLTIGTIVIDDGSTDGTAEAIEERFPDVEIIRGDGSLWCSGAVNLGVKRALEMDVDFILVINDDTVFDSGFLQAMLATAQGNEKSVVGGLLLLWDQPHTVFQVAPTWDTLYGGWRHYSEQTVWTVPERPFEVELIVGNCTLFRASAFRDEGLFATRWLPHYGDAEFTPRLKKRGWKLLIDPRARVFNQPNEPSARLHQMGPRQLYKVLWANYNNGHNLRNRFSMYWLGAPTKLHGLAGFAVFVGKLAIQAFGIRASHQKPEVPFKDKYKTI